MIFNGDGRPLTKGPCRMTISQEALLLALITLLLLFDESSTQCPSKCTCSTSGSGLSVTVSCGPGLTTFPANVPPQTGVFHIGATSYTGSGLQNSISSLSPANFASFTAVTRIRIAFCNVQSIFSSTFSKLSQLVALDLKGNKIKHLSQSMFAGLSQLELLVLTDNVGCRLDDDVFAGLTSLKVLEIGGLKLSSIANLFVNLKSLERLDMHGNDLVRLQFSSFVNLNNLKSLDISSNELYGVSSNLKGIFSKLKSLNSEYNPWRCNCALTWMKSLPAHIVAPLRRSGVGVVCDQPQNLQFKNLIDVPDKDLTCKPARVLSCTSLASVTSGQSIDLTCRVEGDPFPEVTWTLPGGSNISSVLMSSTAGNVNFSVSSSVYSQHNGNWRIVAENCNGSDIKSFSINVVTTTMSTLSTPSSSPNTPAIVGSNSAHTRQPQLTAQTPKIPNSNPGQRMTPFSSLHPPLVTSPAKPIFKPNTNSTKSNNTSSSRSDAIMYVVIAAAAVSGFIFFAGMCICIVAAYKSKRKVRIWAKRKSVYSRSDDFDITSSSTPMPAVKEIIYFQES